MYRKTAAVLLVGTVLLVSCSKSAVPVTEKETIPPDTAVPETEIETEITPETVLVPVSESFQVQTDPSLSGMEEIERLVNHAASLWNHLHISSLDAVYDPALAVEEIFFPLREYPTTESLLSRFRESYTESLSQALLSKLLVNQYRERDGRLYVTPSDRGTDIRAGKATLTAEIVDERTVRVLRDITVCEVYDTGEDFLRYPVGLSPQELMLVYENGRWVFDSFTVFDDLSVYDSGGGVRYEYGEEIARALLQTERQVRLDEGISNTEEVFWRNITGFTENIDGSVAVEVEAYRWQGEVRVSAVHTYTAFRAEDGSWQFEEPFVLAEHILNNG